MGRFSFPIGLGVIVLLLALVNSGCGIGTPSPPAMTPYTTPTATPTSTAMATPSPVPTITPSPPPMPTATFLRGIPTEELATSRPSPSPMPTVTPTPSTVTVTPVEAGQVLTTPVIELPRGPYYPGGPAYVDWKQLVWRPEGQMLAYVGAGEAKGAYLAAAPDFLPRKLDPRSVGQVLWSPDGQRLALLWSEPEGYHLRLVDPSGNTLDEVDLGWEKYIVMNCWLDDERLTIIRHRGTEAEELLEVHIPEHKIYPLVTWEDEGRKLTMGGLDFHWSPSRKSLVIERAKMLISVVDVTQWKVTDLGVLMEGPYQEFESWAPDSTQFLYEQWGEPGFQLLDVKPSLYLWNLAQGEGRWLLPNVWGAAWSPRGDQIAFLLLGNPQRDEQGRLHDTDFVPGKPCTPLYVGVMDPNTYEVKALVSAGQVIDIQVLLGSPFFFGGHRPVWSPDGEQLVYWDANGNLRIMRADGTGQRQLTQGLEVIEVAWSPDGNLLAIATADRLLIIERP